MGVGRAPAGRSARAGGVGEGGVLGVEGVGTLRTADSGAGVPAVGGSAPVDGPKRAQPSSGSSVHRLTLVGGSTVGSGVASHSG